MNPEKRKNLEAKLQAIKDLKAEKKTIGTMQAFKYLKGMEGIYKNPQQVAGAINQLIKEKSKKEQLYYPATQERVVGLADVLRELFDEIEDNEDKRIISIHNPETPNDFDKIIYSVEFREAFAQEKGYKCFDELVYNTFPLMTIDQFDINRWKKYTTLPNMSQTLEPIFSQAQYKGINNKLFGVHAFEYVEKNGIFIFPEDAKKIMAVAASAIDWDHTLSKENLRRLRGNASLAVTNEINIYERIERAIRDQVEHKLEIKREIIADYLYFSQVKSYTDEVNRLKMVIPERLERLREFKRRNALDIMISNEEIGLIGFKAVKYLLYCFATEKNFIERLLR